MNASPLALTELLLKGTAVLLVGYGGARLIARASAAQRSLCWLAVFASMLFLPLALVVPPTWSLPVRVPAPPVALPSERQPVVVDSHAPVAAASSPHLDLGSWLTAAYLGGVAAVLGFRLLGAAQLWRLRRGAVPQAVGQAIVDGWCADLRCRRRVRVCLSHEVTVPMTCGTWRPVILLPSAPLDAAELQAALRHEFAHIRHADAARRWLGTIAAALWWPHPLVWAAFRSWKLEQERACDDAVLNSGADAADYAQLLLDAARGARLSRPQSASALVMAMPAGLETRLRAVTSDRINRAPARLRSMVAIGTVALALTLCGLAFQARSVTAAPPVAEVAEAKALRDKAEAAIVPLLSVRDATVSGAIKEIMTKSGLKIVYAPAKESEARITIHLVNVPASEAIRYITSLANLSHTYKKDGIYVTDEPPVPAPAFGALREAPALPGLAPGPVGTGSVLLPAAILVTREWKIPRQFPAAVPKSERPRTAQGDLTAAGVVFPTGSMATYSPDHSRLVVKNTQANLDVVDALVEMSVKKADGR